MRRSKGEGKGKGKGKGFLIRGFDNLSFPMSALTPPGTAEVIGTGSTDDAYVRGAYVCLSVPEENENHEESEE